MAQKYLLWLKNGFKKRKWLWLIVAAVILYSGYQIMGSEDSGLIYRVKKDLFVIDLKVDGELKALDSYVVKAPSNIWRNARIVRLVPEGETVKKGDFLIKFDTSEFLQTLREAQNNLEKAEANLAQTLANTKSQMAELESNIKLEQYSLEQSKLQARNAIYESENKRKEIEFNLKKAEISYQQLVERKEATKKINRAAIRQAQLEVDQAAIKVKRAQDDLAKLTINSEADGLVVYGEVWEGNQMGKLKVGYSPWRGQALMEIPGQSKMKVSLKINEVDISKIAKDQHVKIILDAVSDTAFTGNIQEIAALANKERRTKKNVFDVEVFMNEFDERLKPGMTAHCTIIIDEIEDVLSVPIDAVTTLVDKVVVFDAGGDQVEITTGKSNADFIIVEKGLDEGDAIRLKKKVTGEQDIAVPEKKSKKRKSSGSERMIIIG